MLTHGQRGLQFSYNFINLPVAVTGPDGTTVYSFSADGTKVGVEDNSGNGYQYMGSLIYAKSGSTLTLESARFAHGYIAPQDGQVYYHTTDHLGSVRAITNMQGSVVERNGYYPFGSETALGSSYPKLLDNRMKFNGKEVQTTGNLGLLDYGARMYDPAIGRWTAQNPLSEKYYSFSAYNYCVKNPVMFVDPDGRAADRWMIDRDGQLNKEINDNNYDEFFIQDSEGNYTNVATLGKIKTKEGVVLVEFPSEGDGFSRYGDKDVGGDHYLQPSAAAALFGAINIIKNSDNSIIVQFGDMSAQDGGEPGTAHTGGVLSHINGTNVDVRYIRNDRKQLGVTVNDNAFDREANQLMVNSFFLSGFKEQLSYKSSTGELLNNTKHKDKHHHHLHIQKFLPNIRIIKK